MKNVLFAMLIACFQLSVNAQSVTIPVRDASGMLTYDKTRDKYFIHVAEQGAIDNVTIYIIGDKNGMMKIKALGNPADVTFSGNASKSSYIPEHQLGGASYYDLKLDTIRAKSDSTHMTCTRLLDAIPDTPYDIPAQRFDETARVLAHTSGCFIETDLAKTGSVRVNAVKGKMTPRKALHVAISNTKLRITKETKELIKVELRH